MSEPIKPIFLVNAYADPVLVRIEGRASFACSGNLKDFFGEMVKEGKTRFVLDFHGCASMDSTFLGVLAGSALLLGKLTPPGSMTLVRVGERNLELLRNLGLHRLATVESGEFKMNFDGSGAQALSAEKRTEIEQAKLVLEAHENLVAADADNAAKFQDVLAFLRNQVESRNLPL
ncbi:MAG: STAS domain-containing protein [Candidatus Didemnitutus sp.]|nr:STAS domain-containing protein [Candidatus Didemnitutus sp.]